MKKYESQFKETEKLEEGKEIHDKIYKPLGVIIKNMAKIDMSLLDISEKESIKGRCKEIVDGLKKKK